MLVHIKVAARQVQQELALEPQYAEHLFRSNLGPPLVKLSPKRTFVHDTDLAAWIAKHQTHTPTD